MRPAHVDRSLREKQRGFFLNPYRFGAPATDPHFANVSLLMHCDGANGGTPFTDSGPDVRTISRIGNTITTQTSNPKFGSASIIQSRASIGYLSVPDDADFDFGTGDFTVEAWIYPTSLPPSGVGAVTAHTNGGVSFYINTMGRPAIAQANIAELLQGSTAVDVNAWTHLAFSRSGTTLRAFRNGVQEGSVTDSTNLTSANAVLIASSAVGDTTGQFIGNLDEIRITKGVARYTANFTPSAIAFPDS